MFVFAGLVHAGVLPMTDYSRPLLTSILSIVAVFDLRAGRLLSDVESDMSAFDQATLDRHGVTADEYAPHRRSCWGASRI